MKTDVCNNLRLSTFTRAAVAVGVAGTLRAARAFEDFANADDTAFGTIGDYSAYSNVDKQASSIYETLQNACGLVKPAYPQQWNQETRQKMRVVATSPENIAVTPANSPLATCLREHAAQFVIDRAAADAVYWASFRHHAGQFAIGLGVAVTVGVGGTLLARQAYRHRVELCEAGRTAATHLGAGLQATGRFLLACAPGWLAHRIQYSLTPWDARAPTRPVEMV